MAPTYRVSAVRWPLVCAVAIVGLAASILYTPPTVAVPGPVGFDKLLHAGGYFGFAIVLAFALAPYWSSMPTRLLVAFAVPVGFGVSMELGQLFVASRGFSLGDILANALGAGVAVVGWFLVMRPVIAPNENTSAG